MSGVNASRFAVAPDVDTINPAIALIISPSPIGQRRPRTGYERRAIEQVLDRTFVSPIAGALAATGVVHSRADGSCSNAATLDALAEAFFACDADHRAYRLEDRDEEKSRNAATGGQSA
jgi:hypothetical protein